jgi:hypothetical protein
MLWFGKAKLTRAEAQVRLVDVVYPIRHGGHAPHRKVMGVDAGGELIILGQSPQYSFSLKGITYDA